MDRVEVKAAEYIEHWNKNYADLNDEAITRWLVNAAMRDLESWIEGVSLYTETGCVFWSKSELLSLYALLAPSASFFNYPCSSALLPDTFNTFNDTG